MIPFFLQSVVLAVGVVCATLLARRALHDPLRGRVRMLPSTQDLRCVRPLGR